jgi:hypothetical protein
LRRTPAALVDQIANLARGYAERMAQPVDDGAA